MRKKHKNIFLNIGICYFFIRLLFDHTFTGVAKQSWSEFIRIHKLVNPFLSFAFIVGAIALLIGYYTFYKVFRDDETRNFSKLARLARFYYYTLLCNIFCGSVIFLLETTTFFAYENYTIIDIVLSRSLFMLIWIILTLYMLGSGREYIKVALAGDEFKE